MKPYSMNLWDQEFKNCVAGLNMKAAAKIVIVQTA